MNEQKAINLCGSKILKRRSASAKKSKSFQDKPRKL